LKTQWVPLISRLLWIVPAILLFLCLNQAKVAVDIKYTLENGKDTVANVLEMRVNDRVDIPFGYVSLQVPLEDGTDLVQEKMALPYTLIPHVQHQDQLDVHVLVGASQQIVISKIAATQWKMAALQSSMCLVGFIMSAVGVFLWNRLLRKKGDPAEESPNLSLS